MKENLALAILTIWPGSLFAQSGDVNRDGCIDLEDFAVLQRELNGPDCASPSLEIRMVEVPGGGIGPAYDFLIGRFEITNVEFVAFLNSAQADGGRTRRGSYMQFQGDGRVQTLAGENLFRPESASGTTRIHYDNAASIGRRYWVVAGFTEHPVTHVSWLGALKFCNWLSIDQGFGEEHLCYAEATAGDCWRPVSIGTAIWRMRDLNALERQELVNDCGGFRLPMDNLASFSGYVPEQENGFNEWYKAAAYDPRGPSVARLGLGEERISARHWLFSFGRDTISPGDANYYGSHDLFDNGTTPAGHFDGVNWLGGNVRLTNDTGNPWGLYDLAGNVSEWVQDKGYFEGASRSLRGGNWSDGPGLLSASYRSTGVLDEINSTVGFRVLRVP